MTAFRTSPQATDTGQWAENLALRHLEQQGLKLIQRNYRCRLGEIDLIMQHQDTVVLVEVRARRNARYGGPAASVDQRKQLKLIQCARHYIAHHQSHAPMRFDVVAVSPSSPDPRIEWIVDAFQTE